MKSAAPVHYSPAWLRGQYKTDVTTLATRKYSCPFTFSTTPALSFHHLNIELIDVVVLLTVCIKYVWIELDTEIWIVFIRPAETPSAGHRRRQSRDRNTGTKRGFSNIFWGFKLMINNWSTSRSHVLNTERPSWDHEAMRCNGSWVHVWIDLISQKFLWLVWSRRPLQGRRSH